MNGREVGPEHTFLGEQPHRAEPCRLAACRDLLRLLTDVRVNRQLPSARKGRLRSQPIGWYGAHAVDGEPKRDALAIHLIQERVKGAFNLSPVRRTEPRLTR